PILNASLYFVVCAVGRPHFYSIKGFFFVQLFNSYRTTRQTRGFGIQEKGCRKTALFWYDGQVKALW
ncbi:MAG: hypothetical protein IJT41_08690, partial [Clostridia bacterium]|nr:hypothetical protein [Clostridia bacterium]